MAKSRKKISPSISDGQQQSSKVSVSDLKQDLDPLYRIRVLLYDLRNMLTNRASEHRTLRTTNELYISDPYFTASQANLIKAAITQEYMKPELEERVDDTEMAKEEEVVKEPQPVEKANKARLTNFLEKRRASGNSRPCGPHDMAPIYESVFGINRSELQDDNFIRRVNKAWLPNSAEAAKEIHKESNKDTKC